MGFITAKIMLITHMPTDLTLFSNRYLYSLSFFTASVFKFLKHVVEIDIDMIWFNEIMPDIIYRADSGTLFAFIRLTLHQYNANTTK